MCWDHVVSTDLVHWKKLPPAVCPTPGWYDADGCFSGAVELDAESGLPVILYTGVYLKTNEVAVKNLGMPPPECDLQLKFVESQVAAVPADPGEGMVMTHAVCCEPVCCVVTFVVDRVVGPQSCFGWQCRDSVQV